MVKRLNLQPEDFFLTREGTREKFSRSDRVDQDAIPILGTPCLPRVSGGRARVGMLRLGDPDAQHRRAGGDRVTSWPAPGISRPTRRCSRNVDWSKFGVDKDTGEARDPRCENCMTQCGFEPSGALGINAKWGDTWKNLTLQLWSRGPSPPASGHLVDAYNGVTSGTRSHHRGRGDGEKEQSRACRQLPCLPSIRLSYNFQPFPRLPL